MVDEFELEKRIHDFFNLLVFQKIMRWHGMNFPPDAFASLFDLPLQVSLPSGEICITIYDHLE